MGGYKEVIEEKPKTEYVPVCKYVYQTKCTKVKVPYTDYVTECEEGYEEKCDTKKVEKCEDVPKTTYVVTHKRVPTQIEGKIAFRVCDGESDHEYTPEEVRTIDFSEHQS